MKRMTVLLLGIGALSLVGCCRNRCNPCGACNVPGLGNGGSYGTQYAPTVSPTA